MMAPDLVVTRCIAHLNAFAEYDQEAVAWAAYDWLQANEAGIPMLPMVEGKAREDARFWAETANAVELECYMLASADRLGGMYGGQSLFASRQIKRLVGALFKRMSPDEQAAFAKWIGEQTK